MDYNIIKNQNYDNVLHENNTFLHLTGNMKSNKANFKIAPVVKYTPCPEKKEPIVLWA